MTLRWTDGSHMMKQKKNSRNSKVAISVHGRCRRSVSAERLRENCESVRRTNLSAMCRTWGMSMHVAERAAVFCTSRIRKACYPAGCRDTLIHPAEPAYFFPEHHTKGSSCCSGNRSGHHGYQKNHSDLHLSFLTHAKSSFLGCFFALAKFAAVKPLPAIRICIDVPGMMYPFSKTGNCTIIW